MPEDTGPAGATSYGKLWPYESGAQCQDERQAPRDANDPAKLDTEMSVCCDASPRDARLDIGDILPASDVTIEPSERDDERAARLANAKRAKLFEDCKSMILFVVVLIALVAIGVLCAHMIFFDKSATPETQKWAETALTALVSGGLSFLVENPSKIGGPEPNAACDEFGPHYHLPPIARRCELWRRSSRRRIALSRIRAALPAWPRPAICAHLVDGQLGGDERGQHGTLAPGIPHACRGSGLPAFCAFERRDDAIDGVGSGFLGSRLRSALRTPGADQPPPIVLPLQPVSVAERHLQSSKSVFAKPS